MVDLHLTTYELSSSSKVSLNFIKLTKKTNKKQNSQKRQTKNKNLKKANQKPIFTGVKNEIIPDY